MQQLLEIMARLRDPEHGCPWDLEQDFRSIVSYTIEEAHEVADAVEREDPAALADELGDLLFQVVFHARMATEQGWFDFDDVVTAICTKLVRRHPHVFGDKVEQDADTQTQSWEAIKEAERKADGATSHLDGVSGGLPALRRSVKLQKRAARVGFDWATAEPVLDKIHEELAEVQAEMAGGDHERLEDELGDVLFAVTNLARLLKVDPGAALRRANHKFERRFRWMEARALEQGTRIENLDLDAQEALWQESKRCAV